MTRDEELLRDGARVESGEHRGDDVTLAPREGIGAAEEIERLARSCASKCDGQPALVVPLERRSLDHYPSPVHGTLERMCSGPGACERDRVATG